MDDRWEKVGELFTRAQGLPEDERARFLDTNCGSDHELRAEVESLLNQLTDDSFDSPPHLAEGEAGTSGAFWASTRGPARDSIGPYKILEVLGEGGMGVVYLVEQTEPIRRRVALKCMTHTNHKEFLARFEAERQALAMMNHPNIAMVHDAGATEDGQPYFAMEHIVGVPITEYCDSHRLKISERLKLLLQVCQGVAHAHHRGIIHRDLKPSNILVTAPDNEPVAKIIDFGVAKATTQRLTEKTLYTEVGRIIGTPQYMSPEQAQTTGEVVDHRTDVYSLGVLLYKLLVGELPLELDVRSLALDEVMRRIRNEEPATQSTRWSRLNVESTTKLARERRTDASNLTLEIRGDLDWVTMKALEKERNHRYQTATELARDIERHLRTEPVEAGPPSVISHLQKFARRNRGPVLATCAVGVALIIGTVASLWFALEAQDNLELARTNEARAEANAQEARTNALSLEEKLDEVLGLSDIKRLSELEAEEETLWPAVQRNVGLMEAWLRNAEELASHLEQHRETLTALQDQALYDDSGFKEGAGRPLELKKALEKLEEEIAALEETVSETRTWRFEDTELQWQHDTLGELVEGIERFADADPKIGALSSVKQRLEFAKTVRKKTVEDYQKEWDEAIASIANPEKCPQYKGLKITPQVGLIPIGQDPDSDLWEFAHLQTGKSPERGEEKNLVLQEETGLVFVLLPGGTFHMGAVRPSEEERAGSPNVDPDAEGNEGPVHEVTLDPFFISKYEMTQGQWLRFREENPSAYGPDWNFGYQHSLLHPVEQVSWKMCDEVLRQLDLILPTEAQWEYACRGGRGTVWWTVSTLTVSEGDTPPLAHGS